MTIGAGVTVSASINTLVVTGGTGAATATVLGTLTAGFNSAAVFRGTLNIGNGGTTGTLIGNVLMTDAAAIIKFNRSDAYSYDGKIGQVAATCSAMSRCWAAAPRPSPAPATTPAPPRSPAAG